jgi:hypothetical protein
MTFRTKIFTPGALSKTHRDIIYRPRRHKLLLTDPGITVTMSDDEEIKLEPMSMSERPHKRKSLHRLLELLQDSKDWQNLPAFLEGMQLADEKLPKGAIERFVRKANEQGRTGIIIRCAEMVKKTGLSLADPIVTTELMLGIHFTAVKAGFKGEELDKAVRHAQVIALLMEKPEHCAGKARKTGEEDMRKDLTVLGVLLELKAAQAEAGATTFGTLPKIASKILALWTKQDLTVNETPTRARIQLERWLPLWAGMKLALKNKRLEDPKMISEMTKARDALTSSINKARKIVKTASQGRPRRCLHMYDDVKGL